MNAIDLKAIRDVASVTSDSERMQFKPSTVIALLDRMEAQLKQEASASENVSAMRNELVKQLNAAKKDAARIDWLEKNLFNRENIDPFTKKPCTKFNMWVLFSPKGVQGSTRRIIDAAMKEQK